MSEILIYTGDFSSKLSLPFVSQGVKAGFPSPALDYMGDSLDFNRDIVIHPEATFYARVSGDSLIDVGIEDGDILVVDRALDAKKDDLVIVFINGEFCVKFYDDSQKDSDKIIFHPGNKAYPDIIVTPDDEAYVWGVVAWSIKAR